MHAPCSRVIYRHRPYLAVLDDAGNVRRAHGPFTVGSEPHLADCTTENEVHDPKLLGTLGSLAQVSPAVPPNKQTLAGG